MPSKRMEAILGRPVAATSHEAYDSTDSGTQRARIWRWMEERGRAGATSDEADEAIFPARGGSFRRFSEMRRLGMIRYALDATGKRERRNTRSGKPAYVHVAVPTTAWEPINTTRISFTDLVAAARAVVAATDAKDGKLLRTTIEGLREVLGGTDGEE